jgi:hypothetical protein
MQTNSEDRQQLAFELVQPPPEPHVEPVTPELIRIVRRKPTLLHAWNFAQEFSGLQDKQIYEPLAIDSSHWTKIGKGTASPPADGRFTKYFQLVGNEFPLIWLAEACGYDWTTIRKHQSNEQKRIADLERENTELKRAMSLWAEAHRK